MNGTSRRWPALFTAMATPFDDNGQLNLSEAEALANHLVDTGTGGIIVAGTTGESPTLSTDEMVSLFSAVTAAVGSRATVLAGTGKNDTTATIELTRRAATTGVDGVMLVTPYYNRPSQRGLERHVRTVAASVELPVMLYDVPSRTACEYAPETLVSLAEDVDNVVAVKDAVGNIARASWIVANTPDDFDVYCGDDKNCLPMLAVGAVGLVSVAAHVVGEELAEMISCFESDPVAARAIHQNLLDLFNELFLEPSPAPVKSALEMMRLPGGNLRLPMVPVLDETRAILYSTLSRLGKI